MDTPMLRAAVLFAASTLVNTIIGFRRGVPGEPFGLAVPGASLADRASTLLLTSGVSAPWPMPAAACARPGRASAPTYRNRGGRRRPVRHPGRTRDMGATVACATCPGHRAPQPDQRRRTHPGGPRSRPHPRKDPAPLNTRCSVTTSPARSASSWPSREAVPTPPHGTERAPGYGPCKVTCVGDLGY